MPTDPQRGDDEDVVTGMPEGEPEEGPLGVPEARPDDEVTEHGEEGMPGIPTEGEPPSGG